MKFKKPKFWDLNEPNLIAYLLLPFTFIIKVNNFFLNNSKKRKNNHIKSICIGNIYLGGTGKTPSTIKIFNITNKLGFNVVTAKKFYENQLDEQIILEEMTNIITGRSRKKIMDTAVKMQKDLIIFDDGLQDKETDYDIKIVCFNVDNWIGNGQLLPAGPLRENLDSIKKYDVVFIKGQNFNKANTISNAICKINPTIKIFFTNYEISNKNTINLNKKYLLFCGTGNPSIVKNFLINEKINIVSEIIFPDHYNYEISDIQNIQKKAQISNLEIITTKKDYVKIPEKFRDKIDCVEINLNIKKEDDLVSFLKKRLNEKY